MTNAGQRDPGRAVRRARQLLDSGRLPPAGLVVPTVARSWQRCLGAGLQPGDAINDPPHLSAARLAEAQARRQVLLARARPVMEYLRAQIRDAGSMIVLADDRGVVIEAMGDADFMGRAQRVALAPGASWREVDRGTNAIGTALVEGGVVSIHGGEHFLDRNGFLTCCAAPLLAPDGVLMGILDISGHFRGRHPHTNGLVGTASHMIENRLFMAAHEANLRLRFHPRQDGVGTVAEGLLAVSEDGAVLGANRAATALLGPVAREKGGEVLRRTLNLRLDDVLDWARRAPGSTRRVIGAGGHRLYMRVDPPLRRARAAGRRAATATVADALGRLDSGDPTLARAIARARKVVDKPIALLLHGETGVGKELFAQAVHASGPRSAGPFVAVNCAALPETLIEAELFGYAPGAFTGARRSGQIGRLQSAHGGTLFLDEIGDMPLGLQSRLLRVLEEHQVVPLGGGAPRSVDFALIAASHRSLKAAITAGAFRADLYYRLNGLTLELPPLRQRRDQPALIARLLAEIGPGLVVSDPVARAFAQYSWPGNIRQLANVLRSAAAMLDLGETQIDWIHLPDDFLEDLRHRPTETRASGPVDLRSAEDALIARTIETSHGNLSAAARQLGISRSTLYRRLRRATGQ